jgi:hypothetical protein
MLVVDPIERISITIVKRHAFLSGGTDVEEQKQSISKVMGAQADLQKLLTAIKDDIHEQRIQEQSHK